MGRTTGQHEDTNFFEKRRNKSLLLNSSKFTSSSSSPSSIPSCSSSRVLLLLSISSLLHTATALYIGNPDLPTNPSRPVSSSSPSIYSLTSKYFYAGEEQHICLYFSNFPTERIDYKLSVSLTPYIRRYWYQRHDDLGSQNQKIVVHGEKVSDEKLGHSKCFTITVPDIDDDSAVYNLSFSVKYGIDNEVIAYNLIKIRQSFPMIFITTDKPLYRPGQLVQYKILVLDRTMKPFASNNKPNLLEVFVKNPQNTKLESLTQDIQLDSFGLYSGEFQLISEPTTGKWSIGVQLFNPTASVRQSKIKVYQTSFDVRRYVLPKFEMEIITPEKWYYEEPEYSFKVCGMYTHGKPFKGSMSASIKTEADQSYYWHEQQIHLQETAYSDDLDSDGCKTITIPNNKIDTSSDDYRGSRIRINATITEFGTGKTDSKVGGTSIVKEKYRIDIVDQNGDVIIPPIPRQFFIPGTSTTVRAAVRDLDGQLSSGVKVLAVTSDQWIYNIRSVDNCRIAETDSSGIIDLALPASHDGDTAFFKFVIVGNNNATGPCPPMTLDYRGHAECATTLIKPRSPNGIFMTAKEIHGQKYLLSVSTIQPPSNLPTIALPIYSIRIVQGKSELSQHLGNIRFNGQKLVEKEVTLTDATFPGAKLAFIIVLPNNELVMAAVNTPININAFTTSKMTMKTVAEPGENTRLLIKSQPNTKCSVSIVDESIRILGRQKDINSNELDLEALQKQGIDPYMIPSNTYELSDPMHCHQHNDARLAVNEAGFQIFMTDRDSMNDLYYACPEIYMEASEPMVMAMEMEKGVPTSGDASNPIRVRNYMPETWLWETYQTDSSGNFLTTVTVPDTITKWSASMFCISLQDGISLSSVNELTVSKAFFTEINLPHSAVRSEVIEFPVQVFNNEPIEQRVHLTLQLDEDQLMPETANLLREVIIPAYGIHVERYSFSVQTIGIAKITAYVQSITDPTLSDAVEARMKLRAEGIQKEHTTSNLVCLDNDQTSFSLDDHPPADESIIPDSTRTRVTIIDDILGPALENLNHLVKVPYGCGEQNMIGLVPNIAVANYLEDDDSRIKINAIKNAKIGYQRELNYQRDDGSFSAFGMSDAVGSSWLTSFVMRSFADASSFMHIDAMVMHTAKDWLIGTQNNVTGCFPIQGMVLDKSLFNSHDSSELFMTSVALLALTKYAEVPVWNEAPGMDIDGGIMRNSGSGGIANVQKAISNGFACVDNFFNDFPAYDTYTLSQVLYLARFVENATLFDEVYDILDTRKTRTGEFIYWKANTNVPDSYYYQPPPANVEATSYILISKMDDFDAHESYNIMRWLQSQRNEYGGWSSTQNTMMALAALTEYATRFTRADSNLNLNFATKSMSIREKRFKITRKFDFEGTVDLSSISVSGTGCVLVQSTLYYNVDDGVHATSNLDLEVYVKSSIAGCTQRESKRIVVYCAKTTDDTETNMAIFEIELPTGYSVDQMSLHKAQQFSKLMGVSRVEQNFPGIISFYWDRLDGSNRCVELELSVNSDVQIRNSQEPSFTVFDYYDTSISRGMLYSMDCNDETYVKRSDHAIGCLAWGSYGHCTSICHELNWRDPNKCYEAVTYNEDTNTNFCQIGSNICDHGRCIYTFTGYRCDCDTGYQNTNQPFQESCQKSDNPVIQATNTCADNPCIGADCIEASGGYICQCHPGYERDQDYPNECYDANECLLSDICGINEQCVNLDGSYECRCRAGFAHQSGSTTCSDINECEEKPTTHQCAENERCQNTIGSYRCVNEDHVEFGSGSDDCTRGFELVKDDDGNWYCEDINECNHESLNDCGLQPGLICANTHGGYQCLKQVDAN